jgi:hypothetical protein
MAFSKETLAKLKTLAERGSEGEKDNAAALLAKLCEKYGVNPDDVATEDVTAYYWFSHRRGKVFRTLLFQCMYKTIGVDYKTFTRSQNRRAEIGTICTKAQAMEIELDYEFYSKHLQDDIDRLLSAFIQANSIFPPDAPVAEEDTRTSKDRMLQNGIERRIRTLLITKST